MPRPCGEGRPRKRCPKQTTQGGWKRKLLVRQIERGLCWRRFELSTTTPCEEKNRCIMFSDPIQTSGPDAQKAANIDIIGLLASRDADEVCRLAHSLAR